MGRVLATLLLVAACRPPTPATAEPTAPAPEPFASPAEPDEAPQPVAVRINAEYRDAKAGRWAQRFEHDGREVFDRRDEIVAALQLAPGMRVADVGAGTGLFSVAFARAVGKDGRVHAIDVQPGFIEHIAARAAADGLSQLTASLGGAKNTGLPAKSVDVAFLCDAYHHLEYPRTYLRDLFAVIAPGGRLAIVDYDRTRPGTSAWMKEHIRADPTELLAEISAAGFVEVARPLALGENFFVVFERPAE